MVSVPTVGRRCTDAAPEAGVGTILPQQLIKTKPKKTKKGLKRLLTGQH